MSASLSDDPEQPKNANPNIIPRDAHNISRKDISDAALKVLYGLTKAGFQAFLVGGSVRDLLLGLHPKDFDVSTNATPEQVKQVFRGAKIIGRRFRIAHVRFGREIIEVATFRANHAQQQDSNDAIKSDSGILLRDNVYGSLEDDALRRDFTVNALYYTTSGFSVHDYADGLKDLEKRQIRMIGEPRVRYQEDPVRMLRAMRFAAKLDFDIATDTAEPIRELANQLAEIPAARLFEEVLKLFMAGKAKNTFDLLDEYHLFEQLFPNTALHLDNALYRQFIVQALLNTDSRINSGKYVTPAFLFAVFLWPQMNELMKQYMADGMPPVPSFQQASQIIISQQCRHTSIPKRFSVPMKEIWELQMPLEKRTKKRVVRVLNHKRFRAAYDFLLLREQSGEQTGNQGEWWTKIQTLSPEEQQEMISGLGNQGKPRKRNHNKNKSKN